MDKIQEIEQFRKLLQNSRKIVFFGGAGVSTGSGIPDFRSADGLFRSCEGEALLQHYSPEEILSHSFFQAKPAAFYVYYRSKMVYPNAKPNACHLALAKWEKQGRLLGVITQNIDGLHQAAGSERVCELHGTTLANHCQECGLAYSREELMQMAGIPRCTCVGIIKPDVVLYEESLPEEAVVQAIHWLQSADLLIVGGTSLAVYPAAGFVSQFPVAQTVLINKGQTASHIQVTLTMNRDLTEVFNEVSDVFEEGQNE